MDYVADGLIDGRKLRVLAIVDDYSRECVALEFDTSLPGMRVVKVLERLADLRWPSRSTTVDHGPELQHARCMIEAWRIEYNTEHPHSSLSDLTYEEF